MRYQHNLNGSVLSLLAAFQTYFTCMHEFIMCYINLNISEHFTHFGLKMHFARSTVAPPSMNYRRIIYYHKGHAIPDNMSHLASKYAFAFLVMLCCMPGCDVAK